MKTIRIFISSPGDVIEERDRARQVVETLRRRYVGRLQLQPVLWEDLPLTADMSFQQGIDLVLSAERGIDLAVLILWSRLGSPLGPRVKRPDGTEYRSGTEREWHLMLEARAQSGGRRPDLLVYTRQDEPSFEERLRGQPTDRKTELLSQKKLAENFIQEEFHDAEKGTNVRAYHTFDRPVTFSQRLRVHLQELLDALAGVTPVEPVWDIEKSGPPFLGLEAFQPQHAPVFFGREDEILEVCQALRQQACDGCAFVLIAGASGSGKSSLARAGVLPAIVEHELDAHVHAWRTLLCTPGELGADPLAGLAARLAAESALPELRGGERAIADLTEGLRKDPALTFRLVLAPALDRAAEKAGGPVRLLVLVDQLEELLSNPALSAADRDAFAAALEALARSGRAWVLATMRADFFAACQAVEPLRRLRAGRGQCDLLPPGPGALRRLIEEPARLAGLAFEQKDGASLADKILADATGHAELLPLVEHLLADLYAHRTDAGTLTFAHYTEVGGVSGALARHADETYRVLDEEARAALGPVLKTLVTVSGDDEKSFVRQHPALTTFTAPAQRRFIDAFIQARLFTTEEAESATVTIAHDSLLRVWPPAAAWVEANADFLRVRARVENRRQQGGLLLEGDPLLDAARQHLASDPAGFSAAQQSYLKGSWERIEQARSRRERVRKRVLTALSLLLIASLIGASWALHERGVARTQAAKQKELLWAASRGDHEVALRAFAVGHHGEGLAYLARALELVPENNVALAASASFAFGPCAPKFITRSVAVFDGAVQVIAFSPDSRWLGAGSDDQTLRVIEAATGKEISKVEFGGSVRSVSFSPDGRWLGAGSDDQTVRVIEAATGKEISRVEFVWRVSSVSFSPDGRWLAASSGDRTALVVEAATGKDISNIAFARSVNTVSFSPDGRWLVAGSDDQTVRVIEAATGKEISKVKFGGSVRSVSFSPDGRWLAVGSALWLGELGQALVVEAATGREICNVGFRGTVRSVSFSPDGRWLAAGSDDKTARVIEAATGKEISKVEFGGTVTSVSFSPDARWVGAGSHDKTARVIEAATGKEITKIMFGNWVTSVRFSPDGRWFAASSDDKTARVIEAATGKEITKVGFGRDVTAASFSPDGRWLATGGRDQTARVIEAATSKELSKVEFGWSVNAVSFSPDGRWLAAGSDDKTARVIEAATGKEITKIMFGNWVTSVSFSPDGRWLAAGSDDQTARVIEAATGKELSKVEFGREVAAVSFSPDGRWLAAGSRDRTARVIEAATGKEISKIEFGGTVRSVSFSPDCRWLAAGSDDQTARVIEAATGKEISKIEFGGTVRSVSFSPDCRWLVAGSDDQTARVIEAATGKEISKIKFRDSVNSVSFSPNGRRLVAGSDDQTARVIDLRWLPAPRDAANRDWTESLISQAGERFELSGRLRPCDAGDWMRMSKAWSNVVPALQGGADRPWHKAIIVWKAALPERRTTSPWTEEMLIHRIGRELLAARSAEFAGETVDAAPWHPLAPVSLARFEKDATRQAFLARLTLRRLREADESLYGKDHLARYAAASAGWMHEMELEAEAREALAFALERTPPDQQQPLLELQAKLAK